MTLKQRFLEAVSSGELGKVTELGMIVTVPEFKAYFNDINVRYTASFLPAVAIEQGRHRITDTHFVFRVKGGVYRLHPDALKAVRDRCVNSKKLVFVHNSF